MRKQLDALRKAYDYSQQQLRAEEDILQAKRDMTDDYVDQTALDVQILDLQRRQYQAELENEVKTNEITKGKDGINQAQADVLMSLYDQADGLKRQKLIDDNNARLRQEAVDFEQLEYELKQDAVRAEGQLAETASEQRDVQLRLLDLAYRQEKARLQAVLADEKSSVAAKDEAQARLASLRANYDLNRKGVIASTRGPLEDYLASIPSTAAKAQEALEQLEVQGIEGLVDALSHVGEGWEAMRDIALRTIQDILSALIKMQPQKLLFSLIGSAAGVPMGDISGAGGSLGGSLGLGAAGVPGFATGGSINIKGRGGVDRNVLSLNGLPIARVSYGERLNIGNDNNPMSGGDFHFSVNVHGAMSDAEARRTGSQIAAGFHSRIAQARTKGIA
jgi:hypothetical protein